MAPASVQDVLDRIATIDPARVEGLQATVLFDLSGEGGGQWTATIADGQVQVEEGRSSSPDVTLSMEAQDLVAIASGQLNAVSAFMQGRIKISGDMSLAMRMQTILT